MDLKEVLETLENRYGSVSEVITSSNLEENITDCSGCSGDCKGKAFMD